MVQEGKVAAVPITDPEKVRELVRVRRPPGMSDEEFRRHEEEIIQMIAGSGALLKGHFILGAGEEG